MDWLYYLLEANFYLAIFYGFYLLFLQNETFYNANRYYLLITSLLAFILPVLQVGSLKSAHITDAPENYVTINQLSNVKPIEHFTTTNVQPIIPTESFDYSQIPYFIYLIIAAVLVLKLAFDISKIISLWIKSNKHSSGKIIVVELNNREAAFSFFNLLFINPNLSKQQAIIAHEMVHIKQKHSFDVLFFELIQIACWFNPIAYFIKKDIKLLHEYIADEITTKNNTILKHEYAMLLIENALNIAQTPLANQFFNQSILKRRINMLNKKRSAVWARLRLLVALPIAAIMLCVSTMAFTKHYGFIDLLPEKFKSVKDEVKSKKQTYPKHFDAVYYDLKAKKLIDTNKRLLVVNGKVLSKERKTKFISGYTKMVQLKPVDGVKKYGNEAKFGAVEFLGKDIKIVDKNTPNSGRDSVKVLRLSTKSNVNSQVKLNINTNSNVNVNLNTNVNVDSVRVLNLSRNDKRVIKIDTIKRNSSSEKKLYIINGAPINDVINIEKAADITLVDASVAVKKYGDAAKYGAVEIEGNKVLYQDSKNVWHESKSKTYNADEKKNYTNLHLQKKGSDKPSKIYLKSDNITLN